MTPLRLEIRHYETIAAIVEFSTMTTAARHLSISQSAMSHRLAEAERRLGAQLFSRGPDRRLAPTSHGMAICQAAMRAIPELHRSEETVTGTASDVEVIVRIGVAGYQRYDWFPRFRPALRAEHPEIDLDLVVVGDTPGTALAARDADLVMAPGRPAGDHELVPVLDDELVLVCAPSHPLADRGSIEAADLAAETYLTYNAQPTPGFEYDRFVRPSGEAPRIVRVIPQTSAIIELVAAGVGVSVLSSWATTGAASAGRLATARCGTEGLTITWHAIHRRHDEVAAKVAAHLRTHITS